MATASCTRTSPLRVRPRPCQPARPSLSRSYMTDYQTDVSSKPFNHAFFAKNVFACSCRLYTRSLSPRTRGFFFRRRDTTAEWSFPNLGSIWQIFNLCSLQLYQLYCWLTSCQLHNSNLLFTGIRTVCFVVAAFICFSPLLSPFFFFFFLFTFIVFSLLLRLFHYFKDSIMCINDGIFWVSVLYFIWSFSCYGPW